MSGMSKGYVADIHTKPLAGTGNSILQGMEYMGKMPSYPGGEEPGEPGKRGRIGEPGSGEGRSKWRASDKVRDAVLEKAGMGEVHPNSVSDRSQAKEAVARMKRPVSNTSSDTEEHGKDFEEMRKERRKSKSQDSQSSMSEKSYKGSDRRQEKPKEDSESSERSEGSHSTGGSKSFQDGKEEGAGEEGKG